MPPAEPISVDHDLHDALVAMVREHGPQPLAWLTPRVRRERRDARIDQTTVIRTIECSTILVAMVDGRIGYLADVLDGIVLTTRARAPLAGRTDLWCRVGVQPLANLLAYGPLPLESGGEVRRMESGEQVLVGPPGWLPDVPRFGLVGLRLRDGKVSTFAVDDDQLPSPEECQQVRALLADHYRRERWWHGEDDLETRPGELVRAITLGRMEDPDLLSTPYPPLDELLYNPLQQDVDEHHWRDHAAVQQQESISRHLGGIPAALDVELERRARLYGMSFDQFVIAMLGHLAWRTPFAEDCEPFHVWDPSPKPDLVALDSRRDG
ncbi:MULTISPECIES: hypothetical protein [unclassified Nocardioides]|uniref:hypothetical protein n=1 Tax=unclassified Nocardioides TaxID=2615069 RepID=UPI0009F058DA|nr:MULTISPECIES: hypothetical protein [unclassified Nocardioides]GAW49079.1 hypothetical protein PD653B2_1399 [Nocardioides sp. PD653-B2]GAW53235.1 hypothetical protein PD653_0633 [Nocardioides sp. PD653]